jgi:hypothetical protein
MSQNGSGATGLHWRKARRSANNGACIEAALSGGRILVRDSKDPDGPMLGYAGATWRMFTSEAKMGRYDKAPSGKLNP